MVAMKIEIRRLSNIIEAKEKSTKYISSDIGRCNSSLEVLESFGYPVKTTPSDVSTIFFFIAPIGTLMMRCGRVSGIKPIWWY